MQNDQCTITHCSRKAYPKQRSRCILHSVRTDEDPEAFQNAVGEQLRVARQGVTLDFRDVFFPFDFKLPLGSSWAAADFRNAVFMGDANFHEVSFSRKADFGEADFHKSANFAFTRWGGPAQFVGANFLGEPGIVSFEEATFEKDANLVIHFTLVMNQAILGLALLGAKTESVERRFSKTSGGVH